MNAVLLAVRRWYNFHEFGCHLGNVGLENLERMVDWKDGLALVLGATVILCGLALKLGKKLDELLLARHRLAIYSRFQDMWLKLDEAAVPELTQIMAASTVDILKNPFTGRYRILNYMLMISAISWVLTTFAIAGGQYILSIGTNYSIRSSLVLLANTFTNEFSLDVAVVYLINLIFDVFTVYVTYHLLTIITSAKVWLSIVCIVIDTFIAVALSVLCFAFLGFFYLNISLGTSTALSKHLVPKDIPGSNISDATTFTALLGRGFIALGKLPLYIASPAPINEQMAAVDRNRNIITGGRRLESAISDDYWQDFSRLAQIATDAANRAKQAPGDDDLSQAAKAAAKRADDAQKIAKEHDRDAIAFIASEEARNRRDALTAQADLAAGAAAGIIYGATTLIPTIMYMSALLILIIAKPLAAAGRSGFLYYLEHTTEVEPSGAAMKFKPFTLLGVLFSVLGALAGAGISLMKL